MIRMSCAPLRRCVHALPGHAGRYISVLAGNGVSICDRVAAVTVTPPGSASWLWPRLFDNGRYLVVINNVSGGSLVIAPNLL